MKRCNKETFKFSRINGARICVDCFTEAINTVGPRVLNEFYATTSPIGPCDRPIERTIVEYIGAHRKANRIGLRWSEEQYIVMLENSGK